MPPGIGEASFGELGMIKTAEQCLIENWEKSSFLQASYINVFVDQLSWL